MKNYDPNIRRGTHKIKITLQCWDYTGHITWQVGGNCRGRDIIAFFDFFDFCEEDLYTMDSDCELMTRDDGETFCCKLKNEAGDVLSVREDADSMNDMIVAIEIVGLEKSR